MFYAPGQLAAEANATVDAQADDERYQRMSALESLWNGAAYKGRPSFWDGSVPLRERAPAIQSMLPRTVGRRLVALVLGDRTFPSVTVERESFGVTLSGDEAEALSALAQDIIVRGKLRQRMRALMESGLKSGSACAIVSILAGRPHVAIEPAKHCYPTLDDAGRVTRLVVTYKTPHGAPGEFAWYRREIGDGRDRVYALQPCDPRHPPDWTTANVERETSIPFVPVVWVRNVADAEDDSRGVDGHALIEGLEAEVFGLDMEISQLWRNALYNGDPQMVQVGVSGTATPAVAPQGRLADAAEWARGWMDRITGSSGPAAKKGPGQIWKMPQGGDAKMLESTGAGAQIIRGAIEEIRRVITDALGVVIADPQVLGRGDLSAKALEIMLGPMLDTASVLRVEYGAALLSILDTVMRLCADPVIGRGVYLPTLRAAAPVLARLYAAREDETSAWLGAPLALRWPDMIEPSWSDVTAAVDAAQKATGGRPVLSQRAALRLIAPVVGVEDLDAEAADVSREAGADAETMRETMGALSPASDAAPVEAVQDTALNGAQVDAMVSLAEKVALGAIPLETAVRIAVRAFQLSEIEAREMFAPAALSERAEAVAERVIAPASPVTDGSQPIE